MSDQQDAQAKLNVWFARFTCGFARTRPGVTPLG